MPLVQLAFDSSIGFPPPFSPVGQCTCCHGDVETVYGATNDNSELFCADCYSEKYETCEDCACELDKAAGEDHYFDEHRRNDSAGPYCAECFHGRFTRCPYCREYVYNDNIIFTGGADYCADCYNEHFTVCDGCGDCINLEDCNRDGDDGDTYCGVCYTNRHRNEEAGDFPARSFRPHHNSTHRIGSDRKFGVELETSSCDHYMDLEGHVHFGAKDDGSISGKEFVSTILHGDAGLAAIEDFCERANAMGFKTNSSCGYHVHCDVSDLSPDQLRTVATAYFLSREVWTSFVSAARRNNHYCGPTPWNLDTLASHHSDFRYWSDSQDRYAWFNVASYARYGTFEIRLHSATLDADKVTNWVVAHIRFIDAVAKMSVSQVMALFQFATKESKFAIIAHLWRSPARANFYAHRADDFGSPVRLNLANAS